MSNVAPYERSRGAPDILPIQYRFRAVAIPSIVHTSPIQRLCRKWALKDETKQRKVSGRLPLAHSRVTPNMAAVAGKIVTTGTQAANHKTLSKENEANLSIAQRSVPYGASTDRRGVNRPTASLSVPSVVSSEDRKRARRRS